MKKLGWDEKREEEGEEAEGEEGGAGRGAGAGGGARLVVIVLFFHLSSPTSFLVNPIQIYQHCNRLIDIATIHCRRMYIR